MRSSLFQCAPLTVMAMILASCAGVGFVATGDPYKKLSQAMEMVDQDRCGLAELTVHDAMKIFREEGNQQGIADAHLSYGLLYKNYNCHVGRSGSQFKAAGTYDSLYEMSISNFESATRIYEEAGNDLGVVNSLSSMAEAMFSTGEKTTACSKWIEALARYNSGKASGNIAGDRVSTPGYNNMGEVIDAYLKQDCDSQS